MIIQHNISALNAHRQLSINNSQTGGNLERLSSGYRINRAADDAAGLAISEKMRGQIRGLAKAEDNVDQATNLIQTAEGGLQETHAILHRMRELAVQSANGTYDNPNDRAALDLELQRMKEEINRISMSTHYNGIQLLDGSTGQVPGDYEFNGVDVGEDVLITLGYDPGDTLTVTGNDLNGESALLIFREDGTVFLQIGDQIYEEDAVGTGKFTVGDVEIELTRTGTQGTGVSGTIRFTLQGDTATPANPNAIGEEDMMVSSSAETGLIFQIGANGTADQRVGIYVNNMSAWSLGTYMGADFMSIMDCKVDFQDDANEAIDVIDAAVNQVSAQRAELGALQNRLEHALSSLGVTKENLTAAESTIRDVDMAKEMMEYTKNSILVQASQAMLAQAQSLPQGVLQLLQ